MANTLRRKLLFVAAEELDSEQKLLVVFLAALRLFLIQFLFQVSAKSKFPDPD